MSIFQVKSLGFHVFETPFNVPPFPVCLEDFFRFLNIGANDNVTSLGFLTHHDKVGIWNHMVKGPFFTFLKMGKEILKRSFAYPPLGQAVVLNADKKGMS